MTKRLVPILVTAALIPAALVPLAGCGGDDNSGSGDSIDTPSSLKDAEQKAEKLSKEAGLTGNCEKDMVKAGESEDSAKKFCDKARVPTDTGKLRKKAYDSCIKIAKEIPVESERDKSIAACKDSLQ